MARAGLLRQVWDWISFTTTVAVAGRTPGIGSVAPLPALVLHVTFQVTFTVRLSGVLPLGVLNVTVHAGVASPFTAAQVWPGSPKPVVVYAELAGTVTLTIVACTLAQIRARPKSPPSYWIFYGFMSPSYSTAT
jgi:hypothetical protein